MKKYYILHHGNLRPHSNHYDEVSAIDAVERIYYTDDEGKEHNGPHWSIDDIREITNKQKFKENVTDWDKYVALNYAYADFNKIMSPEMIAVAAYAFFFDDEDAPEDKVYRYVEAMK